MTIKELDLQLQEAEKKLRIEEQEEEFKKILREYHGADEVISFEKQRELLKNQKQSQKFLTSIPSLDRMINGFQEGELTIITAPTGQGKTTLCQSLTRNFSNALSISC